METKHTPTPWHWHWADPSMQILGGPCEVENTVLACTPCKACRDRGARCLGPNDTDADFIVRAVNNHEQLLDALEIVYNGYLQPPGVAFDWDEWATKTRAAIAKTKGE